MFILALELMFSASTEQNRKNKPTIYTEIENCVAIRVAVPHLRVATAHEKKKS